MFAIDKCRNRQKAMTMTMIYVWLVDFQSKCPLSFWNNDDDEIAKNGNVWGGFLRQIS